MCRNQDRSKRPEPERWGQKQPRDRGFNPRDWEGSSGASPASSPRQRPQQQPDIKPAEPSTRPDRSAARSLNGKKSRAGGAPGYNDDTGLDEWEPTGAGRKGWYNPQSSPSPAAASKETRPVDNQLLNSMSGSGDQQSREEPHRASSGDLFSIALQSCCRLYVEVLLQVTLCMAPADTCSQEGFKRIGMLLGASQTSCIDSLCILPALHVVDHVRTTRFTTSSMACLITNCY